MEELIAEVDQNDRFINLRPRSDFHKNPKLIHRSANLLIFNTNKDLLLQKRSDTKDWFPGLYDFSVSGAVGDESYEECIEREAKEELGLEVELTRAFKFFSESQFGRSFKVVFIASNTGNIKTDVNEVESIRWISIPDLQAEMEKTPDKFTPQFIEGIKRYIKYKNS